MAAQHQVTLGLDFGTESVRAVLLGTDGIQHASAVSRYRHGQLTMRLPGLGPALPERFALQHPEDWLESAREAIVGALMSVRLKTSSVIGIGVDFTSCTVLPARADGTPMCLLDTFRDRPHAWPKLWKHHGALTQTDDLNEVAQDAAVPWLARYGGQIGLEWLFPKMLETFDADPELFAATDLFIEAGDWVVWQLTGASLPDLVRSTCQAGYKACWSAAEGYPSESFLDAVRLGFADAALTRLPGQHLAPGSRAGVLSTEGAERLGLKAGVPVATATIDAHAAVPGVGASEPGTLVMVLGTSACHMLNAAEMKLVPGIAGIVQDGILPGFVGYEMGQAAVGDAFAWLARFTDRSLDRLSTEASVLPPGAHGVRCLDWFNGCRTPYMDGSLKGVVHGLTLQTTPAHLYRAIAEGTAHGLRWIVELLQSHNLPIQRIVATGGLPHRVRFLVQIYADTLGMPIEIHPSQHTSALGAAILGAVAAGPEHGGYADIHSATQAMSAPIGTCLEPRPQATRAYHALYAEYRELAEATISGAHAAATSQDSD